MTRCLMIGPGAIGLTIGTGLLDNGVSLEFAGRTGFGELHYTGPDSERSYQVNVTTDAQSVGHYDVVFLAAKAHQTSGTAQWLASAVGPESILVVLQNGIDHLERLSPYVGSGTQIVPAVVYTPAQRSAPGVVHNTGRCRLIFPDDEPSRTVAALFEGSLVNIKLDPDWHTAAWGKLLMNAASGIIAVLTHRAINAMEDAGATELFRSLLGEAEAVARADGANLDSDIVTKIVSMLTGGKVDHVPSIAVDRIAGHATEWEARNQVVIDLADKYGIAVPLNRMGTTLIRLGEPL